MARPKAIAGKKQVRKLTKVGGGIARRVLQKVVCNKIKNRRAALSRGTDFLTFS